MGWDTNDGQCPIARCLFRLKKGLLGLNILLIIVIFFLLRFTPCKAKQPLQGIELQEKETQKD